MGKKSFYILPVLFIGVASFFYFNYLDYYKIGDTDRFECSVGETFTIKLHENGSTGIVNCWLNESEFKIVQKLDESYEPGIRSILKCDGCGGIVTYRFKAIAVGYDTIKIAHCPVGPEGKDCEDYTTVNTQSDNEFVIEVKK